jgi:hypothetical protein
MNQHDAHIYLFAVSISILSVKRIICTVERNPRLQISPLTHESQTAQEPCSLVINALGNYLFVLLERALDCAEREFALSALAPLDAQKGRGIQNQ